MFTSEPPKEHLKALIAHPNLVCTPHLGASTVSQSIDSLTSFFPCLPLPSFLPILVLYLTSLYLSLTLSLSISLLPLTSPSHLPPSLPTPLLPGNVHAGMYTGALGILNGYGMLDYISDLAARGYDVKIVGHSLGAGTVLVLSRKE